MDSHKIWTENRGAAQAGMLEIRWMPRTWKVPENLGRAALVVLAVVQVRQRLCAVAVALCFIDTAVLMTAIQNGHEALPWLDSILGATAASNGFDQGLNEAEPNLTGRVLAGSRGRGRGLWRSMNNARVRLRVRTWLSPRSFWWRWSDLPRQRWGLPTAKGDA